MPQNETLNKPSILDQNLISVSVSAYGKWLNKMGLKTGNAKEDEEQQSRSLGFLFPEQLLDPVFPFRPRGT